MERDPTCQDEAAYSNANQEVHKWFEREEVMWCQRSKLLWLKEGDQNSKFFYTKASQRMKKIRIIRLKVEKGVWMENEVRDQLIRAYF